MSFAKRDRQPPKSSNTPAPTESKPEVSQVEATEAEPVEVAVTPAPTESKPVALRVAPGRSVMTGSARGMLLPGDEVKPEFFSGGQARIDQLRRGGYLV